MKSSRFAGLITVLLVLGVGQMAWGSNGDPLIIGQVNSSEQATVLKNSQADVAFSAQGAVGGLEGITTYDGIGIRGEARNTDGIGVDAVGTPAGTGIDTNLALTTEGRSFFDGPTHFGGQTQFQFSGGVIIQAGSRSATVTLQSGAIDVGTLALATLQTHARGVYVEAAVADPQSSSVTIYLNTKVSAKTRVAWFLFDSLRPSTRELLEARVRTAEAKVRGAAG